MLYYLPQKRILIRLLPILFTVIPGTFLSGQATGYASDIRPILEAHCVKCHHTGGIAPMPLTNYEEVTSYGRMIRHVTETRYMPPWPASTPGIHYRNENTLDSNQIALIGKWMDLGMPRGEEFGPGFQMERDEKGLEDFDLTVCMAEPFEQYDIYTDQFQVFVIPYDIGRDTFVRAAEFVPGNSQIVRSCQVSITTDTSVLKLDAWDPRYGYNSFGGVHMQADYSHWYTWNAGDRPLQFDSSVLFLPARGFFLFHIQYGPTSKKLFDQSSLRLRFGSRKELVQTFPLIHMAQLTIKPFLIKPGKATNFHAKTTLGSPLRIFGLYPQSNLVCRAWDIYARIPGREDVMQLLKIEDWNFHWRRGYQLSEPIVLPKGTEIHAFARYDNTTGNLGLPDDTPTEMAWGDQMFEETFIVHFMAAVIPAHEDSAKIGCSGNQGISPSPPVVSDVAACITLRENAVPGLKVRWSAWDTIFKYEEALQNGQKPPCIPIDEEGFLPGNYTISILDQANRILDKRIISILKSPSSAGF